MPANIPALQHFLHLSSTSTRPLTSTPPDTSLRQSLLDLELTTSALRETHPTPPSPASTLTALTTLTSTTTSPYIPPPSSPLPVLLAYRTLTKTISETNLTIPLIRARLTSAQQQLAHAQRDLRDAKMMHTRLLAAAEKPEDENTPDRITHLKEELKEHKRKKREIMRAFRGFLETMDGDFLEEAGKEGGKEGGQRRIDEMFVGGEEEAEGPVQALVRVIEELMNSAFAAGGEPWVVLPEADERIVRFLVQSGVARADPRDARRIRLVEFGAGFE